MKRNQIILGVAVILCAVFLASCTKETEALSQEEKPLINPPIPGLEKAFTDKEFDISKGLTWNLKNGGSITVPKNAFKLTTGDPASGKATLRFREYHDAAEVYLSGIPMGYKGGTFETAGMFEIRAEQEGQTLELQEEKRINIDLASRVGDKGFNSYALDEELGQWVDEKENNAKKNVNKRRLASKVEDLRPGRKFPLDRKYFALDYNMLMDVYFNHKSKNFNEPLLQEKLKGYGIAWLHSKSYDGVEYAGKPSPASTMVWRKISKADFPSWVKDSECFFEQKNGNTYRMRIKHKNKKDSLDFTVQCIMPLKHLFSLPPEEWANDYKAAFAKFSKEEKRMKLMYDFTRSLELNELGIYNYDRIFKEDDKLLLAASFQYETEFDERVSQPDIVYVPGNKRAVFTYPEYQWEQFPFMPDDNGILFSILPGNILAIYDTKAYKKVDTEALRKQENPAFSFRLKTLKKIESEEDMRKALGV